MRVAVERLAQRGSAAWSVADGFCESHWEGLIAGENL